MSDPEHPPRKRPPWLRSAWDACIDVGVALVISMVLTGAGILCVSLLEPADPSEIMAETRGWAWELRADGIDDPRARELAADFREAVPGAEVTLIEHEGSVWIATNADRPDAGQDPLVPSGLWTGKVVIRSAMDLALERMLTEPEAIPARSPLLATWMLASSGLGFLTVAWWFGARRRDGPLPKPAYSWGYRALLGVGIGVPAAALGMGVAELMEALGLDAQEQGWVEPLLRQRGVLFYGTVGVIVALAPVSEEMFFRRHLFAFLSGRGHRALAYGLSAWLFAVVHLNPSAVPIYLLYGVVFAAAYERTRSAVTPIVAHAVINTSALVVLALREGALSSAG